MKRFAWKELEKKYFKYFKVAIHIEREPLNLIKPFNIRDLINFIIDGHVLWRDNAIIICFNFQSNWYNRLDYSQ